MLFRSVVTLLVAKMQYNKRLEAIERNLSKDGILNVGHDSLFKGHDNLSKEHDSLSKEHGVLSTQFDKLDTKINYLRDKALKDEGRLESMSAEQLNVKNLIVQIEFMLEENIKLKNENKLLRQELRNLKQHSNKQSYNTSNHYYEDEDELEM